MLGWIMKISIISIVIIILLHYLFIFFKTNLTSPQTKDLVSMPKEQYKEIFDSLSNNINNQNIENITTETNIKPNINKDQMKEELKDFLKDLNKQNKQPDLFGGISDMSNKSNTIPQDINSYSSSYSAY